MQKYLCEPLQADVELTFDCGASVCRKFLFEFFLKISECVIVYDLQQPSPLYKEKKLTKGRRSLSKQVPIGEGSLFHLEICKMHFPFSVRSSLR